MSVLYCTVPDRVKYSTVIADEYRKVTEKIDYWRADLRYIYLIRISSLVFFFLCVFSFFFLKFKKEEVSRFLGLLKFQIFFCGA